ncbi:MAG: sulfatase [Armatimonadota bacterium]
MSVITSDALASSRLDRRGFLRAAAGGLAAAPLATGTAALAQREAAPARNWEVKNLVFIVADTFRADHLGCYGSEHVKTPNLDRLANEGVLFANCYADGLPTIPARRVYHTGRSIVPMRVHGGWIPLTGERKTMAQVLGGKGFTTGFIVDTYHHFKPGMNFHQGFSSWQWIRGQETDPYRSGPRDKFDPAQHIPTHLRNDNYDRNMRQYFLNTLDRKSEKDCFCARSFRAGLEWLEQNAAAQRFMLFIDTFDPHEPWDAPRRYQKMYHDDYPFERYLFGYGVRNQDIRPEDLPAIRGLYAAECTLVDKWVGHLLDGMRELGLLDNTLVVFTTDHGTHLGEEGCVQKTAALLNSCVAQLPFILRHPDPAFAGKRVHALVHATDFMPTCLALLGVEHKLPLDGRNFWPLVTGETDDIHEYVITEFGAFASVRDRRWHYFQNTREKNALQPAYVQGQAEKIKRTARGVPHLYDLEKDPEEKTNVVLENADVVEQMQQRLRQRYQGR